MAMQLPNENHYSVQFAKRYQQLLRDGKDYMLCLELALDMFNFKLSDRVGNNDYYDFIDFSGCYMCSDGKFTFYETKK